MNKLELRKEIRNRKRQFSREELVRLSLSALQLLDENPQVRDARTLLLYYSLPDEVDTHVWIDGLVEQGKTVLLPQVIGPETMVLRLYTGRKDLAEGAFHIMEPSGTLFGEERYGEIETAIIPGMAFDGNGHRLGRGKGYYDRFLEKVARMGGKRKMYKIGVCFGFQKVTEVPCESTDIVMDEVVTSV